MIETQQHLAERFAALRDSRTGPVFFIEHGLAPSDRQDLVATVRRSLAHHPLDSGWWAAHCLPLLVAAAEVGYRYRGSGTDFWPLLEDELGAEFGASDRQRIRDLFAAAADRYRGAQPPRTAWAAAFRLIAWPITHALVPLDFHRPLALTLANLRKSVSDVSDDVLYRAVLDAASFPTARFETLLGDAQLIVAVTKSLLGDGANELSVEIVGRIAADLDADHVSRRSVAVARTLQRAARTQAASGGTELPPGASVRGALQLRRTDGAMTLEALFPALDGVVSSRLRQALRRRRFAPQLWGVSARVPSDQLLSGLPFLLKLTARPESDAPLFPGLESVELDAHDAAILLGYQLELEPPLVFAVNAEADLGRQVRGAALSGHRKYWALCDSARELPRGARALGEVGPFHCIELDPAEAAGAAMLATLGHQVRFGVSARFAGAPTVDRDAATPTFARGDSRVVVPQRVAAAGAVSVEFAGTSSSVGADDVVLVVVGDGDQSVRISNETDAREYTHRGVPAARPHRAPLYVAPRSAERTVQALLSGRLSFVLDGFAPLGGLYLTVDLDVAGRTFSATDLVGPLPEVLSAEHPLLKSLLDDETRRLLALASTATLRVRAGSLYSSAWELERQVRPCWWELDDGAEPSLVGETGRLPSGVVSARQPHLAPTGAAPERDEAWLLAPTSLDHLEFGAAAGFTTLCLAPDRASLGPPAIQKPLLLRRRRGANSAVGLEDLMEAYLRWALAETRTLVGELRRRQVTARLDAWIAELCCGETWAAHEAAAPSQDPWALLLDVCDETGLGRDAYVELSRERAIQVTRLAVSEIRLSLPELWARVGPPSDLAPQDYEALDLACERAYRLFAEQCRQRGKRELAEELEDADPGNGPDEWNAALAGVIERAELRPLAEQLLPTDTAHRLMSLDVSSMSVDDVGEELRSWARAPATGKALAGASPTLESLKAIYALWVEPNVAVTMDWRGALDTLIAERPVARAVRYLALRARVSRRGGGL